MRSVLDHERKHPLYEIHTADKGVDPIAYGERPTGYEIYDLQTARVRFTEISEIVGEWGDNP